MSSTALLHFNGTDASTTISNDGGVATWSVAGNAQLDTAQQKFGTASLLLDGTGDGIVSSDIGALPASGGWTINLWVRFNSIAASNTLVSYINSGTGFGIEFYRDLATNKLKLSLSSNGSTNDIASADAGTKSDFVINTWYHIALVRDDVDGKYYAYVDGVLDLTVTSALQVTSTLDMISVGYSVYTGVETNGWIDEFNIDNTTLFPGGTTFTPPTAEYLRPPFIESATFPIYTEVGYTAFNEVLTFPIYIESGVTFTNPEFAEEAVFPLFTEYSTHLSSNVYSEYSQFPIFTEIATLLTGSVFVEDSEFPIFSETSAFGSYDYIENSVFPMFYEQGRFEATITATFRGWPLNLKNLALTEYDSFPFNSFARLNGEYLAAGDGGIFALSGADDNGAEIVATIRFALSDLGIAQLKSPDNVFINYRSDGTLALRVVIEGGETYEYPLEPTGKTGMYQVRVKTGKGIQVNYLCLELANIDGCDFDLDSIRIRPAILSRSIGGD